MTSPHQSQYQYQKALGSLRVCGVEITDALAIAELLADPELGAHVVAEVWGDPCPKCAGVGWLPTGECASQCSTCGGEGVLPHSSPLEGQGQMPTQSLCRTQSGCSMVAG